MKNRILNIGLAILAMIFVVACSEDDDFTGDSTMQASAPNLTVDLDFSNTVTLVEDGSSYNFTVSISEPQIADVVVYLSQTGGDATEGDDFTFPHTVTIPKGSTSASGTITILSDDLKEENESVEITIGTGMEANVSAVNSETVSFNIGNLEEGDLMVNLEWMSASIATDNTGAELDATDLADLRLLLTDVPYDNTVIEADGAGFESLTVSDTLADGEYYLVADFYSAMDEVVRDLNLTLTFDQIGVINHDTYTFASALNTGNSCEGIYYILAKVTKSGDNYTIEEVGEPSPIKASTFIGTSTVVADEWADYAPGEEIEILEGSNENEFFISAAANPYIANADTAYLVATVDPLTGNVTVASNEAFDYGQGDEGSVTGSGTVNACTGEIDLVLDYDLGGLGSYPGYGLTLQAE
ncbi:Calx-beta domain-containing protein [Christiangramia echinicola]|uniref:Calx-beta domain-containing protein n=1 Tax=Christiangramia echinicola TaxID=279359 RepID=A0A1H1P2L7_9FLAO|nr:Calx-beta domain-containing protein [Christiangramia echinicola]SDS05432.1 Calx-beta domain-containing protein [Christiangramia echinicola]